MALKPYYEDASVTIYHGDCRDVLPDLTVDAIVTDPPYGLGFMGQRWDALPPGREWGEACLEALKPGGHLLAFGGTRTSHRLVCAVEDAGFEIRDTICWLYGSGFPKSLDVSKAIDKAAGAQREVVGEMPDRWTQKGAVLNFATDRVQERVPVLGGPATPEAEQWEGWGTALKPAHEPIVVARKPLTGTVAGNVLEHGTGALNIDGCRIANTEEDRTASMRAMSGERMWRRSGIIGAATFDPGCAAEPSMDPAGRWPANVVLDPDAAAVLDEQTGNARSAYPGRQDLADAYAGTATAENGVTSIPANMAGRSFSDTGGASRFFYCAKASRRERGPENEHPTVKPLALMRWLIRLVTPPGGIALDPFMGSGTTLLAAQLEGHRAIGIETDERYCEIAANRCAQAESAAA